MPRYFFHVRGNEDFVDLQGTILNDVQAAKCEAIRFAAALLSDKPDQFWTGTAWTMTVCDDQEASVASLQFSGTIQSGLSGD